MKRTNTKKFKQKVFAYLLECIDPEAYGKSFKQPCDKLNFFKGCLYSEYGHELLRPGMTKQKMIASYFSGLPSCCTIAFSYCDIIELSKQWHDVNEFTEKEEDKICENWFNFMACQMIKLCESYRVEL